MSRHPGRLQRGRAITVPLLLTLLVLAQLTILVSCGSPAGMLPSLVDAESGLKTLKLPPGFKVELYAKDVKGARSMARSPGGILFVGTRGAGSVYAVVENAAGERKVHTLARGLDLPNGVAFKDGALYVAEASRVLRFDRIEQAYASQPKATVVTEALPQEKGHEWKFIRFGPDGRLYIPVGMPCNTCEPEDERFGTIMRTNSDGSGLEIYARGIRNTVGFDWHPRTRELWFTDNGRDWMGDDRPPDELNHAPRPGMHFGFPYAYGENTPDPQFPGKDLSPYTPSAMNLGPHVAALGMRFYTGTMFPAPYRDGIFIAEHGSWNRSSAVGYRVMFVRMQGGKPASYEAFAEGWLDGKSAWGRPVDVEVLPDGSLLVSDDKADAIYRISYQAK